MIGDRHTITVTNAHLDRAIDERKAEMELKTGKICPLSQAVMDVMGNGLYGISYIRVSPIQVLGAFGNNAYDCAKKKHLIVPVDEANMQLCREILTDFDYARYDTLRARLPLTIQMQETTWNDWSVVKSLGIEDPDE